jgi:hypothetical protein
VSLPAIGNGIRLVAGLFGIPQLRGARISSRSGQRTRAETDPFFHRPKARDTRRYGYLEWPSDRCLPQALFTGV